MVKNERKQIIDKFISSPLKYHGPIFDAHVHIKKNMGGIKKLIKYREYFGIEKSIAIVHRSYKDKVEKKFPNKFVFAKFFSNLSIFGKNPKPNLLAKSIEKFHHQGYPVIKYWMAPRWKKFVKMIPTLDPKDITLSEALFEPMFSKIEELGLIFLIHVSDPDIFYEKVYQPESEYGKKSDHLQDLENVLKRHSKLNVQGAHLGSQAEHLDNLGRWFDSYPNYNVDMSSARWMARELGKDVKKSREFFIKYSDRILFGTDLVQGRKKPISKYYGTRYSTLQKILETNVRDVPLPFPDKENDNKTVINGLDLPLNVLEKIYWKNAERIFNL